jgi:acyl-CoA reductase-like NAD-dependent aldehyde dehydrogenase
VGEEVARRAGERMIPASLELGGKDLAVVLPDADLDRASAGIAWAAFTNAGQNCSAVEVVFVAEEIKHAFLEKLREEVKKMAPFVGPLIHEGQKSKVQSHLEEALERGALIVEGGELDPNSPLLLRPTLLTRVHLESRIVLEETFGPVLPVLPYKDLKEVFHFLENSRYGLTISFWTKNPDFLLEKIKGLPVGVITINTHAMTAAIPSLPWSGVKGSGLGATNSHHALHWMVRPQTILVDRSPFREVFWHPYSEIAENLARGFSALLSGSFSISALWRVVRGFLFRWKKS